VDKCVPMRLAAEAETEASGPMSGASQTEPPRLPPIGPLAARPTDLNLRPPLGKLARGSGNGLANAYSFGLARRFNGSERPGDIGNRRRQHGE